MLDVDLRLRHETYVHFVRLGRAPTSTEMGAQLGWSEDDVWQGWLRLNETCDLVVDRDRRSLRMAIPFSAVPTPYRVLADGRWWDANCGLDAFGICAVLGADGCIEADGAGGEAPIVVDVVDQRPSDETVLFHCVVPAAYWWHDVGFT